MAAINAYSLDEAKEMLASWKECEASLVKGQVSSYKVGSREFTLIDMDDIRAAITYWSNLVDSLSGKARTKRVARVVFRDL